jgi:hypothetical protein
LVRIDLRIYQQPAFGKAKGANILSAVTAIALMGGHFPTLDLGRNLNFLKKPFSLMFSIRKTWPGLIAHVAFDPPLKKRKNLEPSGYNINA